MMATQFEIKEEIKMLEERLEFLTTTDFDMARGEFDPIVEGERIRARIKVLKQRLL